MGALLGAVGGLVNSGNKGTNIGNALGMTPEQTARANEASQNYYQNVADTQRAGGAQGQYNAATQALQSNPVLGQLFGKNGQMSQANNQLTQLNNQGFNLTPEDRTAYGQASGDITRQFGAQGQNLAQSLAARGMGQSGAAGAQFSGLQGSQQEQLAKLQQNIAQQRMQTTMQRIGQTQNFLANMGQQAQSGIGQNLGQQNQFTNTLANAAQFGQNQKHDVQAGLKSQADTEFDTQKASPLGSMFNGAIAGMSAMTGQGGGAMGGTPGQQKGSSGDTSSYSPGNAATLTQMFAGSDRRLKKNIIKLPISAYRDVPTYMFQYKDEKFGKGWQMGIMAQDALQHPIAKHAVVEMDFGYAVDYSKLR